MSADKSSSTAFDKALDSVRNFASNVTKEAEYQAHKLAPKLKEAGESLNKAYDKVQQKSVELAQNGLEKGNATWNQAKEGAAFVSHKINTTTQHTIKELKDKAPSLDDINAKVEKLNDTFGKFSSEVKDVAKESTKKAHESLNETITKVKEKFNHSNKI